MLFSIIIPVYNVEKYLEECLKSVLEQVKQVSENCEVLLIDDGSNDSSGRICDLYKKAYPQQVRVFHNINQGLLMTRRFGFQQARGEYIINCDSDDVLEPYALSKLQNIVEKYDAPDVVMFNYSTYDGATKKVAIENIFTDDIDCKVDKNSVLKEFMVRHSIVSMCGKMVKRTCIDTKRDYREFGRISTGEDTLQSVEIFSNAKTFVYLNEVLYDYRCGSGMTGKFDPDYYFTFRRIFEEIAQQKEKWKLDQFDQLFAIKVLQTVGRAITQSRYKKWNSTIEQSPGDLG